MSDGIATDLSALGRTLVDQVLVFAEGRAPEEKSALRERLEDVLREAGPGALETLMRRLGTTGADWTYYPSDPLARRVHSALADMALTQDSALVGADELDPLGNAPVVFLPNHLSYSDANLFSLLVERAGHPRISERLTVIAGPKVYSDPVRRFASLCFGTIKTPQSSARSSEEAVMPARDVARVAQGTIATAHARQEAGDALLVFVEGRRSRSGAMQRALPAVARYWDHPGSVLLPVAITGSERLVPVADDRLHSSPVTIRIGKGAPAARLEARASGNRRLMVDAVGCAIARLLPLEYRGEYADDREELEEARAVADAVFGA
jgi:1-acyl-sn-glycerol-3-phosphate acyltransferase